jgi:hypothetical protein
MVGRQDRGIEMTLNNEDDAANSSKRFGTFAGVFTSGTPVLFDGASEA